MRYFFDCEFMEDGRTIDPLSIGIVSEDGRTFYAEWQDADLTKANDFVVANVLPHMKWLGKPEAVPGPPCLSSVTVGPFKYGHVEMCDQPDMIRLFLQKWIGDDKPEFWAYYASYDWIVMCQLFGKMIDLPRGWPKYVLDLVQRIKRLDAQGRVLRLPAQKGTEHHALADAQWNRDACIYLDQFDPWGA